MLLSTGTLPLNSIIYHYTVCIDQTHITSILFLFIFFRDYTVDLNGETIVRKENEDLLIDEYNQTRSQNTSDVSTYEHDKLLVHMDVVVMEKQTNKN